MSTIHPVSCFELPPTPNAAKLRELAVGGAWAVGEGVACTWPRVTLPAAQRSSKLTLRASVSFTSEKGNGTGYAGGPGEEATHAEGDLPVPGLDRYALWYTAWCLATVTECAAWPHDPLDDGSTTLRAARNTKTFKSNLTRDLGA